LAFHPQEKNLTEEEVSKIRQRIEGRLAREVGAETRT
jgi:phenylalanyl-tRNA synthetase beta subunit